MNKSETIKKTADFVKNKFSNDSSGHDWWHIYRVWQLAKHISKQERADDFVVEMSALLHDVTDYKFVKNEEESLIVPNWLRSLNIEEVKIKEIMEAISSVSFKGANIDTRPKTLEGKIVQDADRLDAIGAIGIARGFAFGGAKNRAIHNPGEKPKRYKSFEDYKKRNTTTINHFYEKLLLLKDSMNTKAGKKLVIGRHRFMEQFLDKFFKEWKGIE